MEFDNIEQSLKSGKVISAKDIKDLLVVAQKAKAQNPNWTPGEFQQNDKGQTSWVDFKNDLDDIQYKVTMGHILSRDEIKFCLVWARKYISDYANEPVTPVINHPSIGYISMAGGILTASGNSLQWQPNTTAPAQVMPYYACAICSRDIDGSIDHSSCIALMDQQVP